MGREEVVSLIIDECRKRYGAGEVFYRGDGLAFHGWRATRREDYLRAHPETRPEHRELIRRAGVTPGMSRAEFAAAWGIIEDDMRDVSARKTADGGHVYARWSGLYVGRSYTLYFRDDTVVGVREDPEEDPDDDAPVPEPWPPEAWFAAAADGAPQFVAGSDVNGDTELVAAEWVEENVFRIREIPLLVNGFSEGDEVEAAWEGGDPTPRFVRVRERSHVRFVRVRASEREVEDIFRHVETLRDELAFPTTPFLNSGHRYGRGVFVFGISEHTLQELPWYDWPRLARLLLPLESSFTDTGARDWVFTDTGTRE